MGISPFVSTGIQGKEEEEMSESSGVPLWTKLLEAQSSKIRKLKAKKQQQGLVKKPRHVVICRRPRTRSTLMKRRARPEGSRRPTNPIEKKVKTLKKLIPNTESMGLDGLFRDTAEYILSLQMRVKVMQIMVQGLTGSNDN